MKLSMQTSLVRRATSANAGWIAQAAILAAFLFSAACSGRAADNNPLLGDWEYVSQDADCPIAGGAPPLLAKVHFAADSETDQFRAVSTGPTDKYGKASTKTTPIKQYVYVPSDPTHTVSIIGTGGYTRWIVIDANHIKRDAPCHPVYQRVKK